MLPRPHSLVLLLLTIVTATAQLISTADVSALRTIRDSLTDINRNPNSNFFSTWDFSSPDPCSTFAGITCSDIDNSLRITVLTLGTGLSGSPGLAGSLSPSISKLSELTQLILYAGIVTGSIPPEIANLKNIRVISLTNNRLTGPIPAAMTSLPNLHTLDLSYNQLTGTIPPQLSFLPQLKVLILASNKLTGAAPATLPPQLLHLDLKINLLSGMLPRSMPSTLRYLSLSQNKMWGPLNGLKSLSELVYLDLSMNRFSGTIPSSLFRPSLSSMFLQRNNLSGGLPPLLVPSSSSSSSSSSPSLTLYSYGSGSIIDLSHNFLTGQLSTILVGAENLFLNNNRLIGTIPVDYVTSLYGGITKTLYLQHNYISSFPLTTPGSALPDSVTLCLTYNCMVPPPVGFTACPASAGSQISRPPYQCSVYNNGSSLG